MIRLKMNDKIIIIIAVVIIIIAGIGIAAYNPPEEEINDKLDYGMISYMVDWDVRTNSLIYSDFAGKKSPYEENITINHGNLKEIMFNLSWTDDKATIRGRFGLDTLTLEVTTPDGTLYQESDKSASRTREGNVLISIPVNGMPSTDTIKANDSYEAEEKLKEEPYSNLKWVNEEFNIKVSVKIGEIRILKKMRDSGNDFDLEMTYDYYSPSLTEDETKDTGSNSDTTNDLNEESDTPPYLSMIIGTGCGRYI